MISSDLSDEQVLYQRGRWEVTERVLEPLEMSDTEILDWMGEYCGALVFYADKTDGQVYELDCFYGTFYGKSIRDVVCKAAAKQEEDNQ